MTTEPQPTPQPGAPTPYPPPAPPAPAQPGAPTPQPAGPQQVMVVRAESNGLATAGFVVALISLLFSFIPLVGLASIPFTLLAAGLCLPALGKQTGRGLAIAGLIISGAAFIVWLVWVLAIAAA